MEKRRREKKVGLDRNGKTKKDKKRDGEIDKQVEMKDWMAILRQNKALFDY